MSDQDAKRGRKPQARQAPAVELPLPDTRRWVARRKAQVVAAIRDGRLTHEDACSRYSLSPEELASWERAIDQHGPGALRVTRLQEFRHP